jgi:hypothetical protein
VAFVKKRKFNFDFESHPGFPELRQLDISNNTRITDLALRWFVAQHRWVALKLIINVPTVTPTHPSPLTLPLAHTLSLMWV